MNVKMFFSALFMTSAMMTASLFAQDGCGVAPEEASCNSCSQCTVVMRPKCDLFSGLRCCQPCACEPTCSPCYKPACKPICKPVSKQCRPVCKPVCVPCKPICKPACDPCKPVCKPACDPCKPVCKPVCVPCKPVCKPVCVPCKPVCKPVCKPACVPCKPVCKPVCVPCCKKFIVKPACSPCTPVCSPCAPATEPACAPAEEPACGQCGTCNACTPSCCAPCRPLLNLFQQVRCDLQVAKCQLDYDLANARCNMINFRCAVRANIDQCKAEADLKEACRAAARSGACGDVEVCIPDRCRPGAAIKGIFRTLFGSVNCCDCGAPSCGCDAEPACSPVEEQTVTPAEEANATSLTPAPAVTEEKVEEINDDILPDADPTTISGKFYNPSNSIVLR